MRKSLLVLSLLALVLTGFVATSYAAPRTVLGELFTADG